MLPDYKMTLHEFIISYLDYLNSSVDFWIMEKSEPLLRLESILLHFMTMKRIRNKKMEVTLLCMIIWLPIYVKKKRIMITAKWKIGIWQAWELKINWE